ncbi:MAG: hypothetical protein LBS56_09485 [Propionibacteriaceae bacterium]|nr:hypothetical protein [Propionibacteriaceae bacterium]
MAALLDPPGPVDSSWQIYRFIHAGSDGCPVFARVGPCLSARARPDRARVTQWHGLVAWKNYFPLLHPPETSAWSFRADDDVIPALPDVPLCDRPRPDSPLDRLANMDGVVDLHVRVSMIDDDPALQRTRVVVLDAAGFVSAIHAYTEDTRRRLRLLLAEATYVMHGLALASYSPALHRSARPMLVYTHETVPEQCGPEREVALVAPIDVARRDDLAHVRGSQLVSMMLYVVQIPPDRRTMRLFDAQGRGIRVTIALALRALRATLEPDRCYIFRAFAYTRLDGTPELIAISESHLTSVARGSPQDMALRDAYAIAAAADAQGLGPALGPPDPEHGLAELGAVAAVADLHGEVVAFSALVVDARLVPDLVGQVLVLTLADAVTVVDVEVTEAIWRAFIEFATPGDVTSGNHPIVKIPVGVWVSVSWPPTYTCPLHVLRILMLPMTPEWGELVAKFDADGPPDLPLLGKA